MTVVESGTGSAALSHALLRTIAPFGHLHTYEFHPQRAAAAREELEQHASPAMVTVRHRDVCGKNPTKVDDKNAAPDAVDDDNDVKGGFDLPGRSVDAVFLDLPEPWLAIPHAAFILKPNARIASYSPCVEQSQRSIKAMMAAGFHSIQTMEYRLQEHYVDEVSYQSPPRAKRRRQEKHNPSTYMEAEQSAGEEKIDKAESGAKGGGAKSNGEDDDENEGDGVGSTDPKGIAQEGAINKKLLVARPFVMMRGHTAFLTFATAGNLPQPNPNEKGEKST